MPVKTPVALYDSIMLWGPRGRLGNKKTWLGSRLWVTGTTGLLGQTLLPLPSL